MYHSATGRPSNCGFCSHNSQHRSWLAVDRYRGKFRPHRNDNFGADDRPARYDSRREEQVNGYPNRDRSGTEPGRAGSHANRGEDRRRGKSYQGSRNGRNERRFNHGSRDEPDFRGEYQTREGEGGGHADWSFGLGNHCGKYQPERRSELPPRFQKQVGNWHRASLLMVAMLDRGCETDFEKKTRLSSAVYVYADLCLFDAWNVVACGVRGF